jgi:DNA polymerase-3 subunit gamma/tau
VDHLGNLLLVAAAPSPERLVGRIAEYRAHDGPSSSLSEDEIVRLMRIALDAQATAKWSTQPTVIVELGLMRMARLGRTVELEAVLKAMVSGGATAGSGTGRGGGRSEPGGVPSGGGPSSGAGKAEAAGGAPDGASLSGVRSVPPSDDDAERWPQILARIRTERPALAAFLNDAVPASADGRTLGLLVPNGSSFHRDQLQDRGNMRLMERAASDVLGRDVRLTFKFGAPGRADARAAADSTGAPSEGAEADPTVRKVLDMFGGEIRADRKGQ